MEDHVACNLKETRDEFNWYLSLVTRDSMYPYNAVLIPKIEAVADLLFQESNFYAFHDVLAAKLLERIPPNFSG
jgi:hypothetical protein